MKHIVFLLFMSCPLLAVAQKPLCSIRFNNEKSNYFITTFKDGVVYRDTLLDNHLDYLTEYAKTTPFKRIDYYYDSCTTCNVHRFLVLDLNTLTGRTFNVEKYMDGGPMGLYIDELYCLEFCASWRVSMMYTFPTKLVKGKEDIEEVLNEKILEVSILKTYFSKEPYARFCFLKCLAVRLQLRKEIWNIMYQDMNSITDTKTPSFCERKDIDLAKLLFCIEEWEKAFR